MAQMVKGDLAAKGLNMTFMPVSHSAASVNVLKPSSTEVALLKRPATAAAGVVDWIHTGLDAYDASVNGGIQQAEDDAEAAVSQCPNVKLIMGGYSQGAIAIHDAEVWLAANKPSVFKHVVGTLLLADPDRVPNTKAKNFGDPLATAGDEGVRTWLCVGKYLCAVRPTTSQRRPPPPILSTQATLWPTSSSAIWRASRDPPAFTLTMPPPSTR